METEHMPAERVSIYLPDRIRAALGATREAPGETLSARIAAALDRYAVIVAQECPSFSRVEWLLLLDACNGWAAWSEAGETLMTALYAEVADHCALNGAGDKWGLSDDAVTAFVARLRALRPAETMAVLERVERFWRASELPTDEALRAAGIQCA